MPNWVKNIIHIQGPAEDIAKAIELMRDKDPKYPNDVNFNNIIPKPERLNIVSGGYDRHYVALYIRTLSESEKRYLQNILMIRPLGYYGNYLKKYAESFTMDIPEEKLQRMKEMLTRDEYKSISPTSMEDLGKAYIDNILEYGHDTWYEWSIDHWGTKWNACKCKIGDDYMEFETAWSAPFPVIATLSHQFPELIFYHEWADEDLGYNCGKREFRNGVVVDDYVFESDKEAHEFACTMWRYDHDEFEEDE